MTRSGAAFLVLGILFFSAKLCAKPAIENSLRLGFPQPSASVDSS